MHQFAVSANPYRQFSALAARELLCPIGHYLWQARTGARFTVVAYHLVGCPAPAAASYLLVQRLNTGERKLLGFGRVTEASAASRNLATIRQQGAQLGANEVHLFALQGSPVPVDYDDADEEDGLCPVLRPHVMAEPASVN